MKHYFHRQETGTLINHNPFGALIFIAILFFSFVSCTKKDTLMTSTETNTFESVAKMLGIRYDSKLSNYLQTKYGTAEKWKNEILKMRKINIGKPHNHKALFNEKTKLSGIKKMTATSALNDNDLELTLMTPDGTFKLSVPRETANTMRILDIAEEQGINLPYSDRAGASSTCVAKLVSGMVDQSDQSFLSDDDIFAGWILTCMAYMLGDVTIRTHMEDEFCSSSSYQKKFLETTTYSYETMEPFSEYYGAETNEYNYLDGTPILTMPRASSWIFYKGPGDGTCRDGHIGFEFIAHLKGKVKQVDKSSDLWSWLELDFNSTQMDGNTYVAIEADCEVYNPIASFTPESGLRSNNIQQASMSWNFSVTTSLLPSLIGNALPVRKTGWRRTPLIEAKPK